MNISANMKRQSGSTPFVWLLAGLMIISGVNVSGQSLDGSWVMITEESDDMDPWRGRTVDITISADSVTILSHWQAGRYWQRDSMTVSTDGAINTLPIRPGKWMNHVYLGVFVPDHATRDVRASWSPDNRTLKVASVVRLETSQADTFVTITSTYRVDESGNRLSVLEERSSRKTGPMTYIFERP